MNTVEQTTNMAEESHLSPDSSSPDSSSPVSSPLRVGYIVRSFPRLSQTFILNEVLALEASGVQVRIFSCTNPHESIVQPQVADVQAQIDYLEDGQHHSWLSLLWQHLLLLCIVPHRYLSTLWYVLRHPEFDEGYTATSRYNCFQQAISLTHLLRQARASNNMIDHLHAHFAHDPTLIAQLVHRLTGIPFTFTAHARDIYQIPAVALAERIQQAEAVVTCCQRNIEYFQSVVTAEHHAKLQVIHNGINLEDFQPSNATHETDKAPLILSASRFVEKKGYLDLLTACHRLKERGQNFRCVIYGDGPLSNQMAEAIDELELYDHVTLAGLCTQQELRRMMPQAAIFALTPFVTDDGDRDGVPTVLAEAMACGVPVVSTTVAGIPELVIDGQNGLLVAPHQIDEITDSLVILLNDEEKRRQFGSAARNTIIAEFNLQTGARQLANLYRSTQHLNKSNNGMNTATGAI